MHIISSDNSPTNPDLWERCLKLARGEIKELEHGGKTYDAPNKGKGFRPFGPEKDKKNSAYLNGWAVQLYNRLGGKWKKKSRKASIVEIASRIADLKKWFSKDDPKGDWVAINTEGKIVGPCAQSEDRPEETKGGKDPLKCLPRSKAESMTPKERASAARRKKDAERKSPNTGKPIHVKTRKS